MKTLNVVLRVVVLVGSLFLLSCSASSNSSSQGSLSGASSPTANTSSPASSRSTSVSVEQVQRAVDKALDWTRRGGRATVLGIQELPQENAARADIRFDDFQYNANTQGSPVSKDKKAPPEPSVNDPNFYEKMLKHGLEQTQVKRFSGQGVGILKHYNDGRWVLTEIHFDFVGVSPKTEVK
jgi:hypothetical protein